MVCDGHLEMGTTTSYFGPELFGFLQELEVNNNREWFLANKERYEDDVRHAGLRFISDFGPHLRKISPNFVADPRPVGGSMFRIYRDVRFSKDKSPYKTAVGIQFRHKKRRDVHSPGFYLHLEPDASFAGVGIYHPDGATLRKIREFLVENPERWKRTIGGKRFREIYELGGASLKRAPKGYDPNHPMIEDLKRKDFIGFAMIPDSGITAKGFLAEYTRMCRSGAPLVEILCEAVGVSY